MFSALEEYLIEVGLDVSRDKIKNSIQEKQVRERLEDFIRRQSKYNFSCAVEEEIDFGALTDYLRTDLIDDVRVRLRGTSSERSIAHRRIMNRVRALAQAKTTIGEKRAMNMVTKAIEILRTYYRSRINADLLFVAAEITDTIIDAGEQQHTNQTQSIVAEMDRQRELAVAAVSDMLQFSPERVIAEGMRMVEAGDVATLEKHVTEFTNAVSTKHTLFPNYGFDFRLHNGTQRLTSVPLTSDAKKQFPPKFKCVGTIKIGEKYVDSITPDLFDYANRHQLPILLNVTQAQKLLGTEPDPVQYEAEEWAGKEFTIPPKPFRKAFSCSISINSVVAFDYVLFRTQEILDDGTIIVSNREQTDFPFSFTMRVNLETQRLTFTVSLNNASNADTLKYVRFLKNIEGGGVISIKSLEPQDEFARGRLDDFHYQPGFEDIEQDIHFWEMVVALEKHFDTVISVPVEIYESQYNLLQYLYDLISGETNTLYWSPFAFRINLNEELKSNIAGLGDTPFTFVYVGSVEVPLWDGKYEVPITRKHLSVKLKDLERLKRKADAIDIGEEICLDFIPGDGDQGVLEDTMYQGSVDAFLSDIQFIP